MATIDGTEPRWTLAAYQIKRQNRLAHGAAPESWVVESTPQDSKDRESPSGSRPHITVKLQPLAAIANDAVSRGRAPESLPPSIYRPDAESTRARIEQLTQILSVQQVWISPADALRVLGH